MNLALLRKKRNLFPALIVLTLCASGRAQPAAGRTQAYVGIRSYLTGGGSVLFSTPLALEIEVREADKTLHETLTADNGFGPESVGKSLQAMGDREFSVSFDGTDGGGTAKLLRAPVGAERSESLLSRPFTAWNGTSWQWAFEIKPQRVRFVGGGTFTSYGLKTFGAISEPGSKAPLRYRETYWQVPSQEYERVRAAIFADEDPELIEPEESLAP